MKPQEILDHLKQMTKDKASDTEKMEFINSLINPIAMHMEQRSDEWLAARLGVLSASTSAGVMSKYTIEKIIDKNLAEMALGQGLPMVLTDPMKHGMAYEEFARAAYERKENVKVKEVGFVYLNSDERIGCSPDGLVGDKGMVEFKCPNSDTHMGYCRQGPEKKYIFQMQHQMLCNKREWCDFVSFDPRITDERLGIYIQRVYKCEKTMVDIFTNLTKVVAQVDEFLSKQGLYWDKNLKVLRTIKAA